MNLKLIFRIILAVFFSTVLSQCIVGPISQPPEEEDGGAGGDADTDADADADTPSHTGTNVQEKEVDEADIVKTDGKYLYVLSSGELVIVSTSDTGQLSEMGRMDFQGTPRELFLQGDVVVVFTAMFGSTAPAEIKMEDTGFDQDFNYRKSYTRISIVDVSDRSELKKLSICLIVYL